MSANEKINYVEYPASDLEATKDFFSKAFGWTFVDYGPDYAAFSDQGLDGGFLNPTSILQLAMVRHYWFFTVKH